MLQWAVTKECPESAHRPAHYSRGLISFLVNERRMVDGAESVSGPCHPGQACEQGLTTPCLQYRIRTELGTKPCILLCLHSVYISDTKGALGGRSADRDWPRKWAGGGGGGPHGVIWCCHQCTLGEHVISQPCSKRSCLLLTCVNLFIYLNQITNKSKIKTGMWKFLCCGGLS